MPGGRLRDGTGRVIRLTIDGRAMDVHPGTSVLDAALAAGIDVPRLCHHPDLAPSGGCRLCLVEVEGSAAPQASCGLAVRDGMVVRTVTPRLTDLRRGVLDLLLSDHPFVCATCARDGDCALQTYAHRHGIVASSFGRDLSRARRDDDNPFFVRDHQYCIMCARCTRVCDEVVGARAIEIVDRGFGARIATPFDVPLADSTCVFCGSCVQVCPTAALVPKLRLDLAPRTPMTRTRTVCGYCGVGCQIEYGLADGAIREARGFPEAPANGEFLCVKGRFGWDFATSPDRLRQPLVRRDVAEAAGLTVAPGLAGVSIPDGYVPVRWDTALDFVADRLARTVEEHGPDAVAGLASARCTNEENYLFQKFVRATVGTNNVDHCARLCHASTVTGLGIAFGSGAMTNPIRDIRDADCVLITGSNTAESHPVIGYEVVRAVTRGASLIVIDPRRVPLVEHATMHLQPRAGADMEIFLALAHVIVREGWHDEPFIAERTEGFAALRDSLAEFTPERASARSGVPAEDIERAARLYALGERQRGTSLHGAGRGHSTILYAMGITQRTNGTDLVLALANLALLTGQIGKPATGVNPLRGQSNVQGACDVGALPNVLPGYRPVTDADARTEVAALWGQPALPERPGLTVVEMTHAAIEGRVRALYVMGENPMLSDPNLTRVEEGLRALDFLVVQEIFPSETARLAHVILPAAAWLEKAGSKTNTERRVQGLRPVLAAPGEARADGAIVADLAARLERRLGRHDRVARWSYHDVAAVTRELAAATPIYRGILPERLGGAGLTWPCPSTDHPGTPRLHEVRFTRGRGQFTPLADRARSEMPDQEFPLWLNTGRILYQYHTGTMTRRSAGLDWREPRGYAEVNRADLAAVGVRDGGVVLIRGRRGVVRTQARVSDRVTPGQVFLSFHWRECPANLLTQDDALDPIARIPEFKICAVRLESPRGAGA